jgi:hypothetical protein
MQEHSAVQPPTPSAIVRQQAGASSASRRSGLGGVQGVQATPRQLPAGRAQHGLGARPAEADMGSSSEQSGDDCCASGPNCELDGAGVGSGRGAAAFGESLAPCRLLLAGETGDGWEAATAAASLLLALLEGAKVGLWMQLLQALASGGSVH